MQMDAIAAPNNRPDYTPVVVNQKSPVHLFIVQGEMTDAFTSLMDQVTAPNAKTLISVGITDEAGAGMDKAAEALSGLPLNIAVYVQGTEAFMWDVNSLAIKQGMVSEQIHMLPPVSNERRVYCTHCYTVMEGVTQTPAVCSGCQRNLLVRDHFSRLHGAYVGLMIDAEDPADLPEVEELV